MDLIRLAALNERLVTAIERDDAGTATRLWHVMFDDGEHEGLARIAMDALTELGLYRPTDN